MKLFIPLLGLLAMVAAEPPVGDGYPAARSHDHDHEHDHDHSDLTRSPSQEYGPPQTFGSSRNALSTEYGTPNSISSEYGLPNTRSTLATEYGPPNARTASPRQKYAPPAARVSISHNYGSKNHGQARSSKGYASRANTPSQEYGAPRSGLSEEYGAPSRSISEDNGTPNLRSGLSEEYGLPNAKTSQEYTPNTRSLDQEYGVPNTRGISQEYGTPAQHSLSQEYGAPELSSRSLSTEYGVPDARSTPSDEYGAPAVARSGISKSRTKSFGSNKSLRNSQGSTHVSRVAAKSFSQKSAQDYSHRPNDISQKYSAPKSLAKSAFGSALPAPKSYSTPGSNFARDSDSYSQEYSAPSDSYGAPAERDLSDTYGVPSARGLSQGYRAPTSRSNLKTNAIASSYSSARSSPSSTYLPSTHSSVPSEQYGAPDSYDASNQGYSYARSSDEELNQEPANYDFRYKVNDFESGSDFGHSESRQENHAEGSYFVVLPDGTKQTVEYEADEDGFKPRISVEPAASARSGYDENASDHSEGY